MRLTQATAAAYFGPTTNEEVPVPEIANGATVLVRALTLAEVAKVQKAIRESEGTPLDVYPLMVSLGACEEDGKPLWPDASAVDALPFAAVERMVKAITRLNGMDAESAQASIDAVKKN